MMLPETFLHRLFTLDEFTFEQYAVSVFRQQAAHNKVYKQFINYLGLNPDSINSLQQIPFLPIEFFKTHRVVSGKGSSEIIFTSSGTSGSQVSKHFVLNRQLYIQSFVKTFELFYGPASNWVILAFLPAYLERKGSSLVYMANHLIKASRNKLSGFYLHNPDSLLNTIQQARKQGFKKILLLGVSFALYDLAEQFQPDLAGVTIMETGGMKGRRIEPIREELHAFLCKNFNVPAIHSEYGMTELLSQAYSSGNGIFKAPPWMRILARDPEDPLSTLVHGRQGGLNVIDLANRYSCSFIATQDLCRTHTTGSFEVLGRFDASDVRGCNLLIANT